MDYFSIFILYKMPPRCPNGTRRNKKSGRCEAAAAKTKTQKKTQTKTQSKTKPKTIKNCKKGVSMPQHRIRDIIAFEKLVDNASGLTKNPEYYEIMEKNLQNFCFSKDIKDNQKWNTITSYYVARVEALKN